MYTMHQACKQVGMNYETLKFYCNAGLVPNVKRDHHNYRLFDEKNIAWIKSLSYLKRCGMSIAEMKEYTALCLEGQPSITRRQEILSERRDILLARISELKECLRYIDQKQQFYKDVLSKKIPYTSNLSDENEGGRGY